MRVTILACLGLVLFASCGEDEGSGGGGAERELSGPVTFIRGGGIDGRRDQLVVKPDGTGTLTVRDAKKPVRLTDKELATLAADLNTAALPSLPADSSKKKPFPDSYGYRVSYDGATVTTDDANMPEQMRGLCARLGAIVDRYSR